MVANDKAEGYTPDMTDENNLFRPWLANIQQRVEAKLDAHLCFEQPDSVIEAMRYSTLGGGKRLRSALIYAIAEAFQKPYESVDDLACAIEMIHAYSLIHDDLPAMDDDDLRRGKPSCHKQFDEATAILAGDALQARAFEILAESKQINPDSALHAIKTLAHSAGAQGMILGQSIDLQSEHKQLTLEELTQLHTCKTGALFEASANLASYEGTLPAQRWGLITFARKLGLAFQIQDDILDVTQDSKTLGKPQGSDEAAQKSTFVRLLGLEKAKQAQLNTYQEAMNALESFKAPGNIIYLKALAEWLIQRTH